MFDVILLGVIGRLIVRLFRGVLFGEQGMLYCYYYVSLDIDGWLVEKGVNFLMDDIGEVENEC